MADLVSTIISVQNKLLGFEINQMIVIKITVTLLRSSSVNVKEHSCMHN